MIKKILIPLMMTLTTLAVLPSGETVKANAEETTSDLTNKTKAVEKGYITNNLVDELTKTINFNDSVKTKFESNFTEVSVRKKKYDDTIFKGMLEPYGSSIYAHRSDGYVIRNNYDNTKWYNTSYYLTRNDGANSTQERFIHIEYGSDYYFKDYDQSKEQPLELAIKFDLSNIEQGILLCYPFTKFSTIDKPSKDFEDIIPIVSINGFNYLSAVFNWNAANGTYKITYKSYNSRSYISYLNNEYAGYVFMEIPFINYIRKLTIASYVKAETSKVGGTLYPTLPVYFLNTELENGLSSPVFISDIDFNTGTLKATMSNSVYIDTNHNVNINSVDTERILLESIVIDGTTLYTKSTGEFSSTLEEIYELYIDSSMSNRFTYSSNNTFIKKLLNSDENIDFNINKINYKKQKKETEDSEITSISSVVDCGTFYAFRYNVDFAIHTLNVNAEETHDFGLSRLFFNILDIDTYCDVNKINGLMFYYKYKNKSTKRSLAILRDKELSAKGIHLFKISENDKIHKTDSLGGTFTLRPATFWEVTGLVLSFQAGSLWNNPNADIFAISTSENVIYDAIISVFYTTKKGDLINLSGLYDNNGKGYTAIINDDGKVSIIDKDKNVHEGYYVDKNGVFRDETGKELDHATVNHDSKLFQKLLSALFTVLVVGGVVYVISAIGPTLAIVFTNRSKNKKKKRRK